MNVVKKLWSGFYCNSAMPQKTIETYFQTLSKVKQPMKEVNSSESTSVSSEPTCKKLKLSPDKENSCDPATDEKKIPLTPEQKSKIAVNKIKAQVKLQSKTSFALHENIGTGWFAALKEEFSKSYFEKLSNFLAAERSKSTVYPPPHQVYSWTHYCDIKDVKVVILGQDPYHGVGQAHGLCFSVPRGIAPPPSLVNMYKELEKDIPGFKHPGHGYLVGWAKQGVLLLNACLTVRAHNANSHKDHGWEMLTDAVIKAVSTHNRNVVFLLWGSYAQKKASVVDKKKHHLLNAPHPSPLSAHRGFFGCGHFSKCNELLIKNGKTPIDWCNLPILED